MTGGRLPKLHFKILLARLVGVVHYAKIHLMINGDFESYD